VSTIVFSPTALSAALHVQIHTLAGTIGQHDPCCTNANTLQVTTLGKATDLHSHLAKLPAYSITALPDNTDSLANVSLVTGLHHTHCQQLCLAAARDNLVLTGVAQHSLQHTVMIAVPAHLPCVSAAASRLVLALLPLD